MAAESEVPERMIRDHRSGYEGFITLMKWGAGISFVTALLVMFVIA